MDTPERPERSLPAPWTPAPAAHAPAAYVPPPSWDEVPDPDAPRARALTPKLVLRAVRRHWWQIALLWLGLVVAAEALIYSKIKPTFSASAWLQVEPTSRTPLGGSTGITNLTQFMETQVQLVTSPDVIGQALTDRRVKGLPVVAGARDPETTLRNTVRVAIPRGTNLILVSTSSTQVDEAERVVAAVTDAYLKRSKDWMDGDTAEQIKRLRTYKERFVKRQIELQDQLKALAQRGTQADPRDSIQGALNRFRSFRQRLDQIELELMDAEATIATLAKMREQTGNVTAESTPAAGPLTLSDAQIDQYVDQAYRADRGVAELHAQIAAAKQRYQAAQRLSAGHDPAVEKYRREYEALRRQNEQLWAQMRPLLRQRFEAAPPDEPQAVDPIGRQLAEARVRLDKLQAEKVQVEGALAEIKGLQQAEGNEAIQARFDAEELSYVNDMYKKVSLALEDLEYQQHGPAKITQVGPVQASLEPSGKKRLALMAGAPLGVLGLLVGLFTLLELRGARVADPEELSSRLRLGVIGVVPPLPSLTQPKGPKAIRDQRRKLEEFVQSLDHLRVTLCASGATADGPRRCVMITSAVGGEGKTTLAAQLAGRCANAGLTTLLVDADLRRPSLGELLEVPEGPGLAEVLLGEATPEEAMVVIGNAGGFHLLPAGSGGHDPSRLLQGERLGQLLARLREAFDIVLVDAPPVLPVPDALLIGRWTDGAVVAVRHDNSRFPLVERAQRRLTSIGVPLLGAVVNGVRPAESSYGAYDYYATTAAGRDENGI